MSPESVLRELGVALAPDGHQHVTPGWIGVDCPLCSPGSGRFRLGLKFPNAANCWVCGPQRLWKILVDVTGRDWKQVREAFSGLEVVYTSDPPANRARIAYKPPKGVGRLLTPHKRYLERRGLSWRECEEVWGVAGLAIAPKCAWSLFLPVRAGREPVSWTCRSISDESGWRYISASPDEERVPHKSLLFGAELAKHAIVINEGPLDALSLGPGGVATFGLTWTQAQKVLMARYPVRVVVANNEPRAVERCSELVDELGVYPGETHLFVPTNKDLLDRPESRSSKRDRAFLKRRFLK